MKRLQSFQDKHKGERCIIACNGPSLNDIPMDKIQDEIVFGLNRGYLKKGLPIKYLVVMTKKVIDQWADEIKQAKCDYLFTPYYHLLQTKHTVHTPQKNGDTVAISLNERLARGHTVTFFTMQLAYGMGFKEIYLIGLDHSYTYKNTEEVDTHHRAVKNTGDDPNHFHPDYFGKGSVWLPYSPKIVEKNYSKAMNLFRENDITCYNLSTYTELSEDIIPRKDFNDVY